MTGAARGPAVVMGTGGFAVELHGLLVDAGYDVLGFTGPDAAQGRLPAPWLGGDEALADIGRDATVFVAVAAPSVRRKLFETLQSMGRKSAGLIHHTAWIAASAEIAEDAIVYPNSTVHAGVHLGRGVLVNSNVTIGHETRIGAFTNLNPGVALGGRVEIGEGTTVGIGARTLENLTIAAGVVIGAGATVIEDLDRPGTYVGTPARRIEK